MPLIDFGNERGQNLSDPIYDKDAVNRRTQLREIKKLKNNYLSISGATEYYLPLSGGTITGGDIIMSSGDIYLSAGTGNIITPYIPHTAGDGNYVAVHTPNTSPGGGGLLASSATLLSACVNPSDERLKKDINQVDDSNSILEIESAYFKWKDNEGQVNSGVNLGVIAQQVQEHIPHAVWENANGILHIDNLALTSMLIHKVKEQDKSIKDLEAKLKAIEKKLG